MTVSVAKARYLRSGSSERALPAAPARGAPPRARGVAKEVVLALAALAGVLSILWFVASLVFGVSLIVFKTGSMSPTMPAGSLALTRSIAAADIRVGEVVTVAVPGQDLPVTHRVVSVGKDSQLAAARVVVLKGDANAAADALPYHLTNARLVVWSAPVLGTALVLLRTPLFLGATTLLVAALVGWAFWPHRPSTHRAPVALTRRSAGAAPVPAPTTTPTLAPMFFEGNRHDDDR